MVVGIAYQEALDTYRFSREHPMQPERFSLAVDLMRQWALLDERGDENSAARPRARLIAFTAASQSELLLAHDADYIDAVRAASAGGRVPAHFGIGPGDTPGFIGMHEAAALTCGATAAATRAVMSGDIPRAFAPAGGLHHAHRERASGFCIYNDAVIAVELALTEFNTGRIAYVDVDAHHGDGVEAAFEARPEVLTISLHESGRYLFPGTGRATDVGRGPGVGSVVNVPLPPRADPACYRMAFDRVVIPALHAFRPDVIVAQLGADSHVRDPLTHLAQTTEGFVECVHALCDLADELCGGRLVALGGGGYRPYCETPVMWAAALAAMLGRPVPEDLPPAWLARIQALGAHAGHAPCNISRTMEGPQPAPDEDTLAATRFAIEQVRRASPLFGDSHDSPP